MFPPNSATIIEDQPVLSCVTMTSTPAGKLGRNSSKTKLTFFAATTSLASCLFMTDKVTASFPLTLEKESLSLNVLLKVTKSLSVITFPLLSMMGIFSTSVTSSKTEGTNTENFPVDDLKSPAGIALFASPMALYKSLGETL